MIARKGGNIPYEEITIDIPVFKDVKAFEHFFWKECPVALEFGFFTDGPDGVFYITDVNSVDFEEMAVQLYFSDKSRAIWQALDWEMGYPLLDTASFSVLLSDMESIAQFVSTMDYTHMNEEEMRNHDELLETLDTILDKAATAIESGHANYMSIEWG
nr:hypothetical protein [Candidatus Sigynarchaeota archaeon]